MVEATETSLPDLDEVVLDALALHAASELPVLDLGPARRRLVIASGNALPTGRILFAGEPALFRDEGVWEETLERDPDIDSVVVISASGTKHAAGIVRELVGRGRAPHLITCSGDSPAAAELPDDRVLVTASREEPITYNTSTYLGMILARTREDPRRIRDHIERVVAPLAGGLDDYEAYYFMVRPEFGCVLEMFATKFDELFGGRVNGRFYTTEQTLHAKTVVPWAQEAFVSIGHLNEDFGFETARRNVPLFEGADFAAVIATGYFLIGRLQAARQPWFKEHAAGYKAIQAELFARREGGG